MEAFDVASILAKALENEADSPEIVLPDELIQLRLGDVQPHSACVVNCLRHFRILSYVAFDGASGAIQAGGSAVDAASIGMKCVDDLLRLELLRSAFAYR